MTDIFTAIAIMSAVCVAAGIFAGAVAYSNKGQRVMLLLACSVLAAVYFQFYGSGQLLWARFVPLSACIIYTNLAAVFAALAAGWSWRLPNTPAWRRGTMVVLLATMALAAITWPLLSIAVRPAPEGGDAWLDGVAMQTSWATCSPAAASTLLNAAGIRATEAELIPLCLTDSSGTPTLGLYRGVKLFAERNDRDVEVLDETLSQLLGADNWPVLLAVELPYGVDDRRYADQWGWIPGMGHSVVALGRTDDGGVIIGDPSTGLERWSEADLKVLWHGNGMRLSR
ncbi:cysteine peptidase family C39 domain-containing protein [Neorhodopirellula lusitana]|uniref:peptidase C39 n=1 Tax=Neorhodopirellula lusitana TaxID=445327 RepID=UPI00384A6D25